jgi:ectoine hydroxylase-related dioxygenase (phytanoyl-CoA dioxygenase family)
LLYKPNCWEGYHIDHDTNSYLPPISELSLFAYVNCHVFLHDVDDNCAPMQVIPGSHYIVAKKFLDYFEQGLMSDRGNFTDIRNCPQFTKPISIKGKKGSVLFYSSYLVHASIAFQNKRLQRAFFGITMIRDDNNSWKRPSWPYAFFNRALSNEFLAKTTARARTLLGWPPPGNSYYNSTTLKLLSKWYPGIDLTRYEQYGKD